MSGFNPPAFTPGSSPAQFDTTSLVNVLQSLNQILSSNARELVKDIAAYPKGIPYVVNVMALRSL